MKEARFTVAGVPAPQGSTRSVPHRVTGKPITMHSGGSTLAAWRADVREAAVRCMDFTPPTEDAVSLGLSFRFLRPKVHFGARGLKPSAPAEKVTKPDLDKLVRAVLDALTGVLYVDDAQVVGFTAGKRYAEPDEGIGGLAVVARW